MDAANLQQKIPIPFSYNKKFPTGQNPQSCGKRRQLKNSRHQSQIVDWLIIQQISSNHREGNGLNMAKPSANGHSDMKKKTILSMLVYVKLRP